VLELRPGSVEIRPTVSHSLDSVWENQIRWCAPGHDMPVHRRCCAGSNTYLKVLTCSTIVFHAMHDVTIDVNTEARGRHSHQEGRRPSQRPARSPGRPVRVSISSCSQEVRASAVTTAPGPRQVRRQVGAYGACAGWGSSTRPPMSPAVVTEELIATCGGSYVPGCRRTLLRACSA